MKFDPYKKENLAPAMHFAISQAMQYILLDSTFQNNVLEENDIVFHGGTSLHIVHGSPRFSEDLDFMISIEKAEKLEKIMLNALKSLKNKLALVLPRSDIRMKMPKQTELEVNTTLKYDVVWSHPAKHGSVRVKSEFYTVSPDQIIAYAKENKRQKQSSFVNSDLNMFDADALTINSLIPAATMNSIYGDKLVALAKRDYLKPRDFFDLWWLNKIMNKTYDDDKMIQIMEKSAQCYRYNNEEIAQGMQRLMQNSQDMARTIEINLQQFLPLDYRNGFREDIYLEMYEHAMSEANRMANLIEGQTTSLLIKVA